MPLAQLLCAAFLLGFAFATSPQPRPPGNTILLYHNTTFIDPIFPPPFNRVVISDCQFVSIITETQDGGAILCFSPLRVINCQFLYCVCKKSAGAIAAASNTTITSCSFRKCMSDFTACLSIEAPVIAFAYINRSSFTELLSSNLGLIDIFTVHTSTFSCVNLTDSEEHAYASGINIRNSTSTIEFTVVRSLSGSTIGSGLYFRNCMKSCVMSSDFINNTRTGAFDYGGVCIIMVGGTEIGKIMECGFVSHKEQRTSSVLSQQDPPVYVISCCFSLPMSIEKWFRLTPLVFYGSHFAMACEFNRAEYATQAVASAEPMGARRAIEIACLATVGLSFISWVFETLRIPRR